MKKIVRLTENDLMRIVKKVIKENELSYDEFDDYDMGCGDLEYEMENTFNALYGFIKRPTKFTNKKEIYNDLDEELSSIIRLAEDNGCDNIKDLRKLRKDYLSMILDVREREED